MAGQVAKIGTGSAIAALIPQTFEDVWRISQAVHLSNMAPYGLNTPEKISVAIMTGLELGLPPMNAINSIAIINNRPCIWGDALPGICYASGAVSYIKEWYEGEGTSMVAYCETLRVGQPEPVRREFSVKDAMQAGLWQTSARIKKKNRQTNEWYDADNDSPWWRYQKRMLQMRARGWALRDTYPDKLKGMKMAEEEQDHLADRDVIPAVEAPRENPLIDPPLPANDTVIEATAHEPEGNDAPEDPQPDHQGEQQDDSPKIGASFSLAGMILTPPSADFSTTDFLTYLGELISATTLEGTMGANAKIKGMVVSLPDTDKPFYQVAAGYKLSIVKGTSSDPSGSGLVLLKEWAMADFGRTA